eukprot:scaffold4472_cov37-Tisochrysis_lutea.AAC.1
MHGGLPAATEMTHPSPHPFMILDLRKSHPERRPARGMRWCAVHDIMFSGARRAEPWRPKGCFKRPLKQHRMRTSAPVQGFSPSKTPSPQPPLVVGLAARQSPRGSQAVWRVYRAMRLWDRLRSCRCASRSAKGQMTRPIRRSPNLARVRLADALLAPALDEPQVAD